MTDKADKKEALKAQREAKAARSAEMETRESKLNEGKTGKGTRTMLSLSRGRNPIEVQYEAFDESKPDTLPATLSEFMSLTGIDKMSGDSGEKTFVSYAIDGFNSASYTLASDPIAEFQEASWPDDVQKTFRSVIRGYAQNANVSIEDAVALIKPGFVASQSVEK